MCHIYFNLMSAFATNQLPTNINTLERLGLWTGLALARINPTLAALEAENASPEKVAQVLFFRAADDNLRCIVRLSLVIDPTYSTQTRKFWENAFELSNTTLPAGFNVN